MVLHILIIGICTEILILSHILIFQIRSITVDANRFTTSLQPITITRNELLQFTTVADKSCVIHMDISYTVIKGEESVPRGRGSYHPAPFIPSTKSPRLFNLLLYRLNSIQVVRVPQNGYKDVTIHRFTFSTKEALAAWWAVNMSST